MDYLPIFVAAQDRRIVVVGGGEIALRKIELLLSTGAIIDVVAKQLCPALRHYVDQHTVQWLAHTFHGEQLNGSYLVIAATNDSDLNQQVYAEATQRHLLVNVVDDKAHCTFILPAIIDRSPIVVAISSGGSSPTLARQIKAQLEQLLPRSLSLAAQLLGAWRSRVKAQITQLSDQRRFWSQLLSGPFMHLVESRNAEKAEQLIATSLAQKGAYRPVKCGFVTLVGAGPGDPELLTLKALRAMQHADVVLYDALISDDILSLVRREAQKVYVGKRAKNHSADQEDINQMLIDYAKQGLAVVRLKGGDPFIFGRGGEELQALAAAGIDYQIIPGITAALGAAAYSGIPLTHRELAHSTTFITGYHTKRTSDIHWPSLAQSNHTLVIYMGILNIGEIADQLLQHGRHRTTPVAVISKATQPEQTTLTGTLDELVELSRHAASPALIIVGEVVKLHTELSWFAKAG